MYRTLRVRVLFSVFLCCSFCCCASEMEMKKRISQELGNKNPAEVCTALLCFQRSGGTPTPTTRRCVGTFCPKVFSVSVSTVGKTTQSQFQHGGTFRPHPHPSVPGVRAMFGSSSRSFVRASLLVKRSLASSSELGIN